jgi:hypothetical protein
LKSCHDCAEKHRIDAANPDNFAIAQISRPDDAGLVKTVLGRRASPAAFY